MTTKQTATATIERANDCRTWGQFKVFVGELAGMTAAEIREVAITSDVEPGRNRAETSNRLYEAAQRSVKAAGL